MLRRMRSAPLWLASLGSFALCLRYIAIAGELSSHPAEAHPARLTTLLHALDDDAKDYTVIDNTQVYKRYASVIDRRINYSGGDSFSFDVWSRTKSGQVVVAVPFNSAKGTFTLIREYSFAHGRSVYSFPSGVVEREKHNSLLDAAAHELDEEGHMICTGTWDDLLDSRGSEIGIPQDKYQSESIFAFLCDQTRSDKTPRDRDDEELLLHIEDNVTPAELLALASSGAMQSNIVAVALLALKHLRLL